MRSFFHSLILSAGTLRKTVTLTTTGLMLAIQVALASYGAVQINDTLRITLSHLALVPTGILFGPVPCALQGALCDIVGFLIKPTGPYFPGFTVTGFLLGLLYGIALFDHDPKPVRIIVTRLIAAVLLNILLNTFWLALLYGPSYWASLPVRTLKNLLQLPFDCILIGAVAHLTRRVAPSILSR